MGRDQPSGGGRAGRAATAALLLGAALVALGALLDWQRHEVGLAHLYGGRTWLVLGGLALAIVFPGLALLLHLDGARVRAALAARLALYAAFAGAAATVAWVHPFSTLLTEVTLGFAAGGFGLVFCVVHLRTGGPPPRIARRVDFALFQLVLLVVLAELGLRVTARFVDSPLLLRRDATALERVDANRLPAGFVRYGFPCNSRGSFDEEPGATPAERRVVVLGDSFGFCAVPHHHHYTTVAERALPGVALENLCVNGIGPEAYLHLLVSEALPQEPDAVVVALFVGNDLPWEREEARATPLLRALLDRDEVLLVQAARRRAVLRRERAERDAGGAAPVADLGNEPIVTDPAEMPRAFPWLADPALEPPTFSEQAFLDIERDRARAACSPDLDLGRAVLPIVDEMRALAGDTPLLFVLIPDEFQVEDALWDLVREEGLDRDRPQRELVRALGARGLPVLDLLPALRAAPVHADGRRHVYHLRDTHWNLAGNAVAGEALAAFLAAEL